MHATDAFKNISTGKRTAGFISRPCVPFYADSFGHFTL